MQLTNTPSKPQNENSCRTLKCYTQLEPQNKIHHATKSYTKFEPHNEEAYPAIECDTQQRSHNDGPCHTLNCYTQLNPDNEKAYHTIKR